MCLDSVAPVSGAMTVMSSDSSFSGHVRPYLYAPLRELWALTMDRLRPECEALREAHWQAIKDADALHHATPFAASLARHYAAQRAAAVPPAALRAPPPVPTCGAVVQPAAAVDLDAGVGIKCPPPWAPRKAPPPTEAPQDAGCYCVKAPPASFLAVKAAPRSPPGQYRF